ncbi:secreted RxLR effector protein 161-like [Nicotiana sylvestris]|uniref:secreted RxLR effector protein 161-like n=1 Tax=Nicotiana sylvestris TaxID=4096 RepID=UPI00388C5EDA
MGSSKSIDTHIAIATKMVLDEEGKSVEHKLYRRMIGSLLYLIISKLDIVFSVGLCTGFQANPKESHLKALKRILKHLKGTLDLCLWYPRGYNFDLVGYVDANYTCFHVERKRTSGTTHFLGFCLVSWVTKKQNPVASSTAEAEYVAAASCCAQGYNFDLVGYVDADYTGFHVERKRTSVTTHFLGFCLVSWVTKKQNPVASSTAEAEYVAAASCCAQ